MNDNVVRFQGKSRKGSQDVVLREQILTLQNLYYSYRKHLELLYTHLNSENEEEIRKMEENLAVIEQQISELTGLIK